MITLTLTPEEADIIIEILSSAEDISAHWRTHTMIDKILAIIDRIKRLEEKGLL